MTESEALTKAIVRLAMRAKKPEVYIWPEGEHMFPKGRPGCLTVQGWKREKEPERFGFHQLTAEEISRKVERRME